MKKDLSQIRKEYSLKSLDEKDIQSDPFQQFQVWLNEALKSDILEPTAAALATAGKNMMPSCRMILLKEITDEGFIFFSNYLSKKGKQLDENHYGSLLFFWAGLERQIRIEGRIERTPPDKSDEYYLSRPGKSRIGAWASPQSEEIPDREWLEQKHADYELEFIGVPPKRPDHWGGYILIPYAFEFWQGRPKRLHDRIEYYLDDDQWKTRRLAP